MRYQIITGMLILASALLFSQTVQSQEKARKSGGSILQTGEIISQPMPKETPVIIPMVITEPAVIPTLPAIPATQQTTQAITETIPVETGSKAEEILNDRGLHGLPRSWSRYEAIMWFPKAQPLPPLLVGSPAGISPILGAPGTSLLIGNRSLDTPMSAGAKITWGWSCGCEENLGVEISYLFTGTRTANSIYNGSNRPIELGRPVFDNVLQIESPILVSNSSLPGSFQATTTNRMTGWEANAVMGIHRSEDSFMHAIAGYRFFLNHEGVRLLQKSFISLGSDQTVFRESADQIDGHTRFHGGQIGLEFGKTWHNFFVEGSTKVAIGGSYEVVKSGGQTNLTTSGLGRRTVTPFPGGSLVRNLLPDRSEYSAFAVLPEGQLRMGYKFNKSARFFVGYNFLYLSDAVRPGDQINRKLPLSVAYNQNNTPVITNLLPQNSLLKRTDFWAQGINIGFEWWY